MEQAWEKYEQVLAGLRPLDRVAVAFSGGVDSTLLLKAAVMALGADRVLAVTADSETYPARERVAAEAVALEIGASQILIQTEELAIPGYAENPVNRCYFCKQELFTQLLAVARERGISHVAFGAIAEDAGEFRPGLMAAREQHILAPLQTAQLLKREVRYLAHGLGLSNWDKPSLACLSSRIPYGHRITPEILTQVDQAEFFLLQLGFRQVRVRHHDDVARIEVLPEDRAAVLDLTALITEKFTRLGYHHVALDLNGYRAGSLNAGLPVTAGVWQSPLSDEPGDS